MSYVPWSVPLMWSLWYRTPFLVFFYSPGSRNDVAVCSTQRACVEFLSYLHPHVSFNMCAKVWRPARSNIKVDITFLQSVARKTDARSQEVIVLDHQRYFCWTVGNQYAAEGGKTNCSHFQPLCCHGKGQICESVPLRDVLRMCGEKSLRIIPSIIQSNAICQTVSLGPQRDRGRVEMSACRALGIIPPVNLLHSRARVWKRSEQTSLCWRENPQMFLFFFFFSVQVHSSTLKIVFSYVRVVLIL